jgi:hypothetical protein
MSIIANAIILTAWEKIRQDQIQARLKLAPTATERSQEACLKMNRATTSKLNVKYAHFHLIDN